MTNFRHVSLDLDLSFEIQRSLRATGQEDHHVLADKIGEAIRGAICDGMDNISKRYEN